MGRYYKNSVKGQLTRLLILTLISSSIIIYMIALAIFFVVKTNHGEDTSDALEALKIQAFKSQMWSKAGLIGMAFQEFVNDAHLMQTNLKLLNSGELAQVPSPMAQRFYYYLYFEAAHDPCKWREVLFPDAPPSGDHSEHCSGRADSSPHDPHAHADESGWPLG